MDPPPGRMPEPSPAQRYSGTEAGRCRRRFRGLPSADAAEHPGVRPAVTAIALVLTLAAQPAVEPPDYPALVEALRAVREPDVGYSGSVTGSAFLPYGMQEMGMLLLRQEGRKPSQALTGLVAGGAAALPALIAGLADDRAIDGLPPQRAMMWMTFPDEYDRNPVFHASRSSGRQLHRRGAVAAARLPHDGGRPLLRRHRADRQPRLRRRPLSADRRAGGQFAVRVAGPAPGGGGGVGRPRHRRAQPAGRKQDTHRLWTAIPDGGWGQPAPLRRSRLARRSWEFGGLDANQET